MGFGIEIWDLGWDGIGMDIESNAEGPDDDGQILASDYEKFCQKYNNIKTSKKWLLSTGTVVEDKLYDFGLKYTWKHFRLQKITADLRRLVFWQEDMDQNFDWQKNFDHDWIQNTVYNLLQEYEANSLKKDHLKMWLLLHVWSFIDKAFENLKDVEAVKLVDFFLWNYKPIFFPIKIILSIEVKRKILGQKEDLIIRKIISEYRCSEAGIFYKGENDTKLLWERGLKTSTEDDEGNNKIMIIISISCT
ncbi:hypothetical protein GLOIN_2v1741550 [Rhizophagus clarus]|uniref:Uncharacterized protein n=1 Tax=Rhizophagus clarus TaxID=94130 RepID=A0A8H3LF09_9GLOM|nr:hypothetical protein GLOIN_2v1741550 [Rhizophagus clarus]